jgi:Na+/proline symporter
MGYLDWIVVGTYLGITLAVGVWLARRASGGLADFFISGRSLPWWLAGTSMAATTFSVDTPLYVTGLVARRGIAGNWEWWAFALSHVLLIYLFARLWRRAEVVTDVELTELRYGGRPAAVLRGSRGLWGVVATDFFQFILAMVGALIVAAFALQEIGGIVELKRELADAGRADVLRFVPRPGSADLPFGTFLAYLGIQWWAFRRSDGGGEFVQRLSACRDEREAERAAWLFNVLHYIARAWPWIVVALAALVIFPELLEPGGDPELGYPMLMLRYLPTGLLGIVVASFLAAFMSTVSTQINWGASYLVNDIYARFIDPTAAARKLVALGRFASVVIVILAGMAAFLADDVGKVFRFMIAIGTGPGAVLILRWFWWRVNAWAELAAMLGGFAIALLSYLPYWGEVGFGLRLAITAGGAALIWVPVMLLTAPEDEETLDGFYRRVRPGGPGWSHVRERVGLPPVTRLSDDLVRTGWAMLTLVGGMLTVGGLVLLEWKVALLAGTVLMLGLAGLRRNKPTSVRA